MAIIIFVSTCRVICTDWFPTWINTLRVLPLCVLQEVTSKVLTLTYFPPVLLFWHRRLQSKRCCCPTFTAREFAVVPVQEKSLAQAGVCFRQSLKFSVRIFHLSICFDALFRYLFSCSFFDFCDSVCVWLFSHTLPLWWQESPGAVEVFFERLYIPAACWK